jgi:hypothetical protein
LTQEGTAGQGLGLGIRISVADYDLWANQAESIPDLPATQRGCILRCMEYTIGYTNFNLLDRSGTHLAEGSLVEFSPEAERWEIRYPLRREYPNDHLDNSSYETAIAWAMEKLEIDRPCLLSALADISVSPTSHRDVTH